MDTQKRIEG